jgi:predicted DCC family thiol-disulfide oxidoreductase YuxK
MKHYSGYQFTGFRVVLGLYLAVHFGTLIPYAGELFRRSGMVPNPRLNPIFAIFPNALSLMDSPLGVQLFLGGLCLLALVFVLGWRRRAAALLLWFGWACLLNRNSLIANPGISYVGWLLLACALIPPGEPLAWAPGAGPKRPWAMPPMLYWGTWWLMAAGYTLSGLHKLQSPSWIDGSALAQVLNNPLARPHGLRQWLLGLPPSALRLATWSALLLEIGFLPLCLFRVTRKWAWLLFIGFHLGILTVVNFADLTLGVLMIHLFTFDARWVGAKGAREHPIVFFDGVCGLCDRFVDFAIAEDRDRVLLFSPLQGRTARHLVDPGAREAMDTVVLVAGGRTYQRSSAVLRICAHLGGIWRLLAMAGSLVPERWWDPLYRFVAGHRHQWFPGRATCRLPSAEERAVFLD